MTAKVFIADDIENAMTSLRGFKALESRHLEPATLVLGNQSIDGVIFVSQVDNPDWTFTRSLAFIPEVPLPHLSKDGIIEIWSNRKGSGLHKNFTSLHFA